MAEPKEQHERGMLSQFGILIGGALLLVALAGLFNTALHLNLALSFSGSSTPLPSSWDVVFGVAAAGVLFVGLSLFGSLVRRKFDEAHGKPLLRVGILSGALLLLVLIGRALQVVALVSTYGSMLAYYSTDGSLDDVKAELAKKPDQKALDSAVSRAAQYNNAGALKLLMDAGADMRQATQPADWRRCELMGRSYEFVKVAIEHGVKPDACPNGATAIYQAVDVGKDDEETAKIVGLLLGAGWIPTEKPSHASETAKELANSKQWTKTVEVLSRTPH